MDECIELRNSLFTSLKSLKKLRLKLEAVSSDIDESTKKRIYRELRFITPRPFQSGTGFRDTGYQSSEGHLEDNCTEGGNLSVAGPGSLTITGSTGVEVGANGKLGAVAVEADLLEFGSDNQGYPGAEVGVTAQVAPDGYSGIQRQQYVTLLLRRRRRRKKNVSKYLFVFR